MLRRTGAFLLVVALLSGLGMALRIPCCPLSEYGQKTRLTCCPAPDCCKGEARGAAPAAVSAKDTRQGEFSMGLPRVTIPTPAAVDLSPFALLISLAVVSICVVSFSERSHSGLGVLRL